MGRHGCGVRMGGVDQHIDALRDEVVHQTVHTAKAADSYLHRLGCGLGGAAGERNRYLEAGLAREFPGQLPRLTGAAEDENIEHVVH